MARMDVALGATFSAPLNASVAGGTRSAAEARAAQQAQQLLFEQHQGRFSHGHLPEQHLPVLPEGDGESQPQSITVGTPV